jgi:hypothetical protein
MMQARVIPAGYNVVGTCGECGGPVLSPMMWGGNCEPKKHCMDCNRQAKPVTLPIWGPIMSMTPNASSTSK